MSHHPCQLGVPAVLQDREPVVGGALLAEGLQTRRRRCCQGFLSAPLVLEELQRETDKQTLIIIIIVIYRLLFAVGWCVVPGAWSSLRPKAEMTFLLTSSWFFNGSKADMLAALTGVACFIAGSAAITLPSRPSIDSRNSDKEMF